jgi:hypothetical protein
VQGKAKEDDMLDTTLLREAYDTLLGAAATVADATEPIAPPAGEWTADQILAHVAIVSATTISTDAAVAAGINPTYDNRLALDAWTLDRVSSRAGGRPGLRERIRVQGEALCALGGQMLSDAELDTLVPALLLSNDTLLVDQPMPLRDLITGLADVELPGHTQQLLALLPAGVFTTS